MARPKSANIAGMSREVVEVLIVGGGQAGLAMSEHLSVARVPHLILERARIAERWRAERWDSLAANGPAWHDRFPTRAFSGLGPDEFASREQVVEYFTRYAEQIAAPVRCGVEVLSVERDPGGPGFVVHTTDTTLETRFVVAATGPFQRPLIPPVVPADAGPAQLHSSAYRNPEQLPAGGVLVVGAGSSGVQIADELRRAGRDVHLSVGAHDRPPRSYRGRDFVWWLGVLGKWDMETPPAGAEHVTIAVSGAHGGRTIDFRELEQLGISLVGTTQSCRDGVISFADDLGANIAGGDASYLALLDEADAYAARTGIALAPEPQARELGPLPAAAREPRRELDLAAVGVTSIVWATGYGSDYGWLRVDAFDVEGRPAHRRGVSTEPGVYFLGLPWLSRRGSSFIWGVWHDARYLADHIAIQRSYQAYVPMGVSSDLPTRSDPMIRRRIRPFNTRDTYPEQNLDNDLCQAVVAGDTIYLRGQIGQDLDTSENVGVGDVEAQAEQAMGNIAQLLAEAGATLQHIVKVTVYLVDPHDRETVYRVMGRWLKGVHPVSTGIVVTALARPEWLVEIDATAVLGGERAA
jgi:putative flavoprotein involved in K+ transport